MEEIKFSLFAKKLFNFGIILDDFQKEFLGNYKPVEINPIFKKQTAINKNLMDLYLKNKISNYLFEYLSNLTKEKLKVVCINIYDKLMNPNKDERSMKLKKILLLYSKLYLLYYFKKWNLNSYKFNKSKSYTIEVNYHKKSLLNKIKHPNRNESSLQSNSSFSNLKSKSSKCITINKDKRKQQKTSYILKEEKELSECTFHPKINKSKYNPNNKSKVHERLYSNYMKMINLRKNNMISMNDKEDKENTFKPDLSATFNPDRKGKEIPNFNERMKKYEMKKNNSMEKIQLQIDQTYEDSCSFTPNINRSQKSLKHKNKCNCNQCLSCNNIYEEEPAYIRLYRNANSKGNLDKESEGRNQNNLEYKRKPYVDLKRIEELYKDYKKEKNKRYEREMELNEEQGITFQPKRFTGDKYFGKINNNFMERENKTIENKENFITNFQIQREKEIKRRTINNVRKNY